MAVALGLTLLGRDLPVLSGGLFDLDRSTEGRVAIAVAVAALVAAAVGMVLGMRWAWALSLLLCGVLLASGLIAYAAGDLHALRLALGVGMAFYLGQRAVTDYYTAPRAPRGAPG
jgi:hypothetical protein